MTPEEFIEMVAPAAAICTEHGLYCSSSAGNRMGKESNTGE